MTHSSLVRFQSSRASWHAKAEILVSTGMSNGKWNAAISKLIANLNIQRQGEKPGAHYRMAGIKQ